MQTRSVEICESDMLFRFQPGIRAVKYDDSPFYRGRYQRIPNGKGMDIVASADNAMYFMNTKNRPMRREISL